MLQKNILSIFIFLIIGVQSAFAGWQPTLVNRIGSQATTCAAFNQFDVSRTFDSDFENFVYPNPSNYLDANVVNRIVLGINRECVGSFSGFTANLAYELEVDVLVEYLDYTKATQWLAAGYNLGTDVCPGSCTPPPTKTSVTKTLKVKYDPNYQTTETELSFFSFTGGYDVKVTVQAIRTIYGGNTYSTAPNNAYIENVIAIERYQNLDMFGSTSLSFATNPLFSSEEGLITINNSIAGAESYDIEWLYVDWYSGATTPSGQGRFAFDFRNNATRVTVKDLTYRIPLIYPEGILLFRVRANGVALPNTDEIISTQWFGASSGSVDVAWISGVISPVTPTPTVYGYRVTGFSKNFTWQHSVSFAEESKKKQVISYFDGALYNRQSVTKNNTTEAAIVGQTIYDFNGRPAVQILPTPVPEGPGSPSLQNLSYKVNFNQTNNSSRSGKNYNYQDFDIDATNCSESKTSSLSNLSGSEKYYSPNNPTNNIHRDRIPNANGYAFSQVEYMPDNTGRIRRQGGVGDAHRLTGDNENGVLQVGKETKYHYGVPYQRDLYRLFANEAGDANRYKKNIVIDPNGQVSVSYIDPMGRVVATALGGDPANSSNMLPVAGRNPLITTVDITEANTKNYVDLTISAENDLFVINNGSVNKFWYKLAVPMLNYQCGATDFCYDCVYDLNISITDECGTELVPINYQNNKVGLTKPPGHECGVDSIIFETAGYFQLTLNQGSYKIKKTISIDKAALNNYIDELLASPNIADCVTSYDDLVIQEKGKLDYTNCNYTCQKCSTDIADLLTAQKITQIEYDEMIKGCDVFCKQTTPCDALYVQMVADMSPGGQYFDNLPQDAAYSTALGNGTTDDLLPASPNNTWLDNNDGAFSYFFGVTGDLTVKLGQAGVVINTWTDVRNHWIDGFEEILVEMHPEHCLYLQCKNVADLGSYAYDDAIRNTTKAEDALYNGFYNPTNIFGISVGSGVSSGFDNNSGQFDPFFVDGVGSSYSPLLESALMSYKTINGTTYDAWGFVDYVLGSQGSSISITEGCLTDYGWTMFRGIYLAKKQEQLNAYYAAQCPSVNVQESLGFTRRFIIDGGAKALDDEFGTLPSSSDPNDYKLFVDVKMKDHCEKACSAYIDHWKQSLAGCNLTTPQIDIVITKLLEVCQAGCDATDPMGTRFAKPGTTPSVKSFREALGTHYSAEVCDDLLIEWPRGNYHDYWAEITPYANRCGCLPGQQAPTPANTCATCGENLTSDGTHLYENIQLAEKEKCKNCITCVNLAGALKELDDLYNTSFNPNTENKRVIMENYFNLRFSFNLTYLEYIDFMRDCAGLTSISTTTVADFRTHMVDYVDFQPIVFGSQQMMSGFTPMEASVGDSTLQTESTSTFLPNSLLLGGSGIGGEALALSAPVGFSTLDKCGCDKLLELKNTYLDYVANPSNYPGCTPGKSFKDFVNDCGNYCEGQWGSLDVDYIWQACKDAVDKDLDNSYSGVGFTWSDIQLKNLDEFVDFDNNTTTPKLFIPENCDCTIPAILDPQVTITDVECDDCLQNALMKALTANAANLKIDGVAVTVQQMYDFLTKPVLKEVRTNYDPLTNTYSYEYIYSKCMFMYPWTNPSYFYRAESWDLFFMIFAQADGCFPPPPSGTYIPPPILVDPCPGCPRPPGGYSDNWPFGDPPIFCNTCYKPNTELLTQSLDFVNQLTALFNISRPQAGNILMSSGWLIDPKADAYIGAPLYSGSCSSNLKYKIKSHNTGKLTSTAPSLTFTVSDASGGGGCAHTSEWTLTFPDVDDNYRFNYITEFIEILPAPRDCNGNSNGFWVGVKIRKPDNTVEEVKYMYATVSNQVFYTEEVGQCKQLCNKPILPVVEPVDYCTDFLDRVAESNAATLYEQQLADLRRDFTNKYVEKCMGAFDYLHRQYTYDEYHYTLYYYDQADNLIKTVPPKGVVLLSDNSIDSAVIYRSGTDPLNYPFSIKPNHNYITNYKYNTLNQLTEQSTPDAGISKFWYDKLGRIVLSQNSKQATYLINNHKKYSYTMYDKLGRIIEAGELLTTAAVTPNNTADHDTWVVPNVINNTQKTQITRTYYDIAPTWQTALGIPNFSPTNLRNRVVATCYYETWQNNPQDYNHATHYTYDVLGNVYQLVQDMPQLVAMGQRYKQIFYNYDLASGNVNLVSYQPGAVDQFYHYYEYDADNRITDVYTSRNPAINDLSTSLKMTVGLPEFNPSMGWQKDAKYLYYLHGPLARVELGQSQVQGTDYTYTLHGWLKAINDGLMQNAHDPGLDGNATVGNSNRWFGRDAASIELGYYKSNAAITLEDYTAIGNNGHISGKTGSNFGESTVSLYNGNIGSMVTTLADKTQLSTNNVVQASSRGAVYQYDQLNRIRESWSFTNTDVPNYKWNNNLSPGTIPQEWLTQYTYDAMGNIETLRRQGGTGATDMDQLTYNYDYGTPTWKNQLLHVDDSKAAGLHTEDIDDQAPNNYTYDEIGNLIADVAEEIQTIEWTVYGKIKKITRTGTSTKPNLEFEYNTTGQRVVKKVLPNNGDNPTITYYVRDASGNIMATYKHFYELVNAPLGVYVERINAEEWDLYGSSRIGIVGKEQRIAARFVVLVNGVFVPEESEEYDLVSLPADGVVTYEEVGYKNYELINHLGNVLATITDRKVPNIVSNAFTYFNAQIVSMTDYYPFGMQIEERSWTAPSNKYRFGFNGKEQDKEGMGGGQSTYDYGFRIYNPAIAKFLSVDPLTKGYPWYTPYQFAGNIPIAAIDLDGLEQRWAITPIWFWNTKALMSSNTKTKAVYEAAEEIVHGGIKFVGTDMWEGSTWRNIGNALGPTYISVPGSLTGGYWMFGVGFANQVQTDFNDNFVNGDESSRIKYVSKLFFGSITGRVGGAMTNSALRYGTYGLKSLSIAEKITKRANLATDFYKKSGFDDVSIPDHTQNINTNLPVYTKTLSNSKNSTVVLYQYRTKNGAIGNYYVNSTDIIPEQVGLLSSDYVEVWKATLKDGTSAKTLNSTHISDAKYWRDGTTTVEGGGQQIFSPELKDNVTWEQIK